jgi:hypothetical protein
MLIANRVRSLKADWPSQSRCHLPIPDRPLGISERPIHRRDADTQPLCNLGALQAFGIEPDDVGGLGACRWLPTLVLSILLRPRHTFALTLQQQGAMAASMVTISLPVGLRVSMR